MLARGSHLQETFALQVAQRRERAQEEQHKTERSVAGRIRQVLLSEDRSRQGEYLHRRMHNFPFIYDLLCKCNGGAIQVARYHSMIDVRCGK